MFCVNFFLKCVSALRFERMGHIKRNAYSQLPNSVKMGFRGVFNKGKILRTKLSSKQFVLEKRETILLIIYIYIYIYIYVQLGPFTQEELDSLLRKIKNRKAAGLDEIPPEVWKTKQFDDILLRHCNAVYNQNPIDRWMKGCILPFPKKGDLGLAKNYRGITRTSIAAKIYNAPIQNRIEPKIDYKMASEEIDP